MHVNFHIPVVQATMNTQEVCVARACNIVSLIFAIHFPNFFAQPHIHSVMRQRWKDSLVLWQPEDYLTLAEWQSEKLKSLVLWRSKIFHIETSRVLKSLKSDMLSMKTTPSDNMPPMSMEKTCCMYQACSGVCLGIFVCFHWIFNCRFLVAKVATNKNQGHENSKP